MYISSLETHVYHTALCCSLVSRYICHIVGIVTYPNIYSSKISSMSSQNSTLTPSQTHALTQLQDLTNTTGGDDSDELIGVLTTVDWNVERAADVIFGGSGSGSHAGPSTSTPRYEELDVNDSEQSLLRDIDRDLVCILRFVI